MRARTFYWQKAQRVRSGRPTLKILPEVAIIGSNRFRIGEMNDIVAMIEA